MTFWNKINCTAQETPLTHITDFTGQLDLNLPFVDAQQQKVHYMQPMSLLERFVDAQQQKVYYMQPMSLLLKSDTVLRSFFSWLVMAGTLGPHSNCNF